MDISDNHEVEDALDDIDPPSTPTGLREHWASTSQSQPLPDFFGDKTVRLLSMHQVRLATPDANRHGWVLGGIKLDTVALPISRLFSVVLSSHCCAGQISWQHPFS